MTEQFRKPFILPHEPHAVAGPVEIFFGMTYEECFGEQNHQAAVITDVGEGDSFSAVSLLVRKSRLHRPEFEIGLPGTSWRESIATPGLSHIDSDLPDRMSPVEVYNALLNGFEQPYVVDVSKFLRRYEQNAKQGPRMIT